MTPIISKGRTKIKTLHALCPGPASVVAINLPVDAERFEGLALIPTLIQPSRKRPQPTLYWI